MCGFKISEHDQNSITSDTSEWSVRECSKDDGFTDAFGEMFFSPSGNSSKVTLNTYN